MKASVGGGGFILTILGAVTAGYCSVNIYCVSAFQIPKTKVDRNKFHESGNFSPVYHHHHQPSSAHHDMDGEIRTANDNYENSNMQVNRRDFFGVSALGNFLSGVMATNLLATPLQSSQWAKAEVEMGSTPEGVTMTTISTEEIVSRLRKVPTFAIVDKRGVPFMVFGEDAKVTAYFFISYNEANRVLRLADASSTKGIQELKKEINDKRKKTKQPVMTKEEEREEVGINPWKDARISTVPLDFAVALSNKGKLGGAYFKVAPSENDINDALDIDKSVDDLSEGKVPLFYFEDLELPTSSGEGRAKSKKQIPLFFQKSQLLEEWKRQKPNDTFPEVKVTELFSVLSQMVRPNKNGSSRDKDLDYLVFIPPKDSYMMEKKCIQNGGKEEPYILGERIVVL